MDTPAQIAASRLAWDFDSWKTIQMKIHMDIIPQKKDPSVKMEHNMVEYNYIETKLGQRVLDEQFLMDSVLSSRSTHYSDGSRAATVAFKPGNIQKSVVIKREFSKEDMSDRVERPTPLLYQYVGKVPLHAALARSRDLGIDKVDGKDFQTFLFEGVRWGVPQDQVFYLDPSTSSPTMVVAYSDEAGRRDGRPIWRWTADRVEIILNHAVPTRSTLIAYEPDGKTPAYTWKDSVESIAFDKEFADSTFWPVLQPGTPVLDAIDKKTYVTPGNALAEPKSEENVVTVMAMQPQDWTGTISLSTLGLGIAILVVGLIYRSRRG